MVASVGEFIRTLPLHTRSIERIIASTTVDSNGCWIMDGGRYVTDEGYPRVMQDRKARKVFQIVCEAVHGKHPDKEPDHTCKAVACICPGHLEPVPHLTNVLRGDSPVAVNARRTHCIRGHRFDTVYHRKDGRVERGCRACATLRRQGKI